MEHINVSGHLETPPIHPAAVPAPNTLEMRIATAPTTELVDLRGSSVDDVLELTARGSVVKIWAVDVDEAVFALEAGGFRLQPQYECVRYGQPDPLVFCAVADPNAAESETSATKVKPTRPHVDGYQFRGGLYRGVEIAGIGAMPQREILAYGILHEPRDLVFFDSFAACRDLVRDHGVEALQTLASPAFEIDSIYCGFDPDLPPAGRLPFVYHDVTDWRVHVGGGVRSTEPVAAHTLQRFNQYLQRTAIVDEVETGVAYVSNSMTTAHAGIRYPVVHGPTVLTRRHLRQVAG